MKFDPAVSAAISASATRFGVDAYFLAAIVMQESGGNTWAMRYEPAYSYLWDVETQKPFRGSMNPATFPAPDFVSGQTEWIAQKTSFGCCQVMGAVAREMCFPGKFLTELCDPVTGIEYGARLIAKIMHLSTDLNDVASAYNAGHITPNNLETYVRPVMAYYNGFKQTGF